MVALLVDVSASLDCGAGDGTKLDSVRRAAAALAAAAVASQDRVALACFAGGLRRVLPPAGGTLQRERVFRALDDLAEDAHTDAARALDWASEKLPRHSVVILISDLLFPDPGPPLRRCASKHDLVALCVRDLGDAPPAELPPVRVRDAEDRRARVWRSHAARAPPRPLPCASRCCARSAPTTASCGPARDSCPACCASSTNARGDAREGVGARRIVRARARRVRPGRDDAARDRRARHGRPQRGPRRRSDRRHGRGRDTPRLRAPAAAPARRRGRSPRTACSSSRRSPFPAGSVTTCSGRCARARSATSSCRGSTSRSFGPTARCSRCAIGGVPLAVRSVRADAARARGGLRHPRAPPPEADTALGMGARAPAVSRWSRSPCAHCGAAHGAPRSARAGSRPRAARRSRCSTRSRATPTRAASRCACAPRCSVFVGGVWQRRHDRARRRPSCRGQSTASSCASCTRSSARASRGDPRWRRSHRSRRRRESVSAMWPISALSSLDDRGVRRRGAGRCCGRARRRARSSRSSCWRADRAGCACRARATAAARRGRGPTSRSSAPSRCAAAALALLVLTASRPVGLVPENPAGGSGVDLVIALDASGSMLALDGQLDGRQVTRLELAKRAVADFVRARRRRSHRPGRVRRARLHAVSADRRPPARAGGARARRRGPGRRRDRGRRGDRARHAAALDLAAVPRTRSASSCWSPTAGTTRASSRRRPPPSSRRARACASTRSAIGTSGLVPFAQPGDGNADALRARGPRPGDAAECRRRPPAVASSTRAARRISARGRRRDRPTRGAAARARDALPPRVARAATRSRSRSPCSLLEAALAHGLVRRLP